MAIPDPLAVDLLDLAELLPARSVRGRLGMCRLPGYEPAGKDYLHPNPVPAGAAPKAPRVRANGKVVA